MTSQPILRALSYVDDAYLESAARSMRARPPIRRWAPAAACLVLACALLLAALLPRPDDGLILNAADVAASISGDPMDSIPEVDAPEVGESDPLPDETALSTEAPMEEPTEGAI